MLDFKLLRNEPEKVLAALKRRNGDFDINTVISLDKDRLSVKSGLETMRHELKQSSSEIGQLMKEKKDAEPLKAKMKNLSEEIGQKEAELRGIEEKINKTALVIPNIPDETVPDGKSEEDNPVIRTWGEPTEFDFEPKSHIELGENLGILDFKRAAKISGARFALLRGMGAKLERGLISFMLNTHIEKGYEEVLPPFIVNSNSLIGTGQLPKFEEDLFKIENGDYYLIPTAEVPVTNIYANEILDNDQLPVKFCAYTPCFRREAGSYGKDTTGLIRQHQFNKVELVKFCRPEDSMAELESLTADAEAILQKLELPYRVVELCTGDLGFSSAKTYDIEVWIPSQKKYREISSCSNFSDFQARRAAIRFKRDKKSKAELLHTVNGSALAIGRTVVAILENYQQADGSVAIPKALDHYTSMRKKIVPR